MSFLKLENNDLDIYENEEESHWKEWAPNLPYFFNFPNEGEI